MSIKDSYRIFFAEEKEKYNALRDLWIEDWLKRNPGKTMEAGISAYENREGTPWNPSKHEKGKLGSF